MHGQFHAETVSLLNGKLGQLKPLGAAGLHRTVGHGLFDVEDLRTGDADAFHGLQIERDALLADVAVDPVPPCVRVGGGWRISEDLVKTISRLR